MTRAALLLAALAACSQKPAEPSGIGPYRFGHTKRGGIHDGICQPTDLNDGRKATWCFALPPIKVGKRTAEVDTYFLGTSPDAPLIEVQLKVRGCVEDEADQWLRARFGAPIESKGTREYWKNSFLWIGAFLPDQPGRCIIHFLPLSENAEIERLKQTGNPADTSAAGAGSATARGSAASAGSGASGGAGSAAGSGT